MPSKNRRICHHNIFNFASMESRARNFLIDKAVHLLQSFRTKVPSKISGDIENSFSNATQTSPTRDRLQQCTGRERTKSISENRRVDSNQSINLAGNGLIEQRVDQQPQFTEGPVRFVMANDGSKDCMGLLVTDTLIAKLRDLHEDSHHLSGKQGPLDYARRETRNLETSINQLQESIEMTEDQGQAEKLPGMAQKREAQLLKLRQRRDKLESDTKQLERNVTSSKAHILWVLDNAMKEADLLEPHRPLTPVTITDIESEAEIREEIHHTTHSDKGSKNGNQQATVSVIDDADFPTRHSILSTNTDNVPEENPSLRRAAWESYNENLVKIHKVQALFDNRQQSYETDLADYQQGFADGIYNISRSEFDRSKIRYVQKVTRALIDAEEAFEAAKEYAQAVGALRSDYDDVTDCYGCYEESWPESQLASYLDKKDWGDVHYWLAELPERSSQGQQEKELEPPEVDEWYADDVDPADSISQVDFDDCRKDIDHWEQIRFDRWEDMRTQVGGPEVQVGFLVRSIETLRRRHSVSLCGPNIGWKMGT